MITLLVQFISSFPCPCRLPMDTQSPHRQVGDCKVQLGGSNGFPGQPENTQGGVEQGTNVKGRLMTPNCEQLRTASVRPMMLVWRVYDKYMSSLTPQMCSALQWTCLTTWDNTCPYPFAKCWCCGSDTTQITVSISTTSQLVWSWRTTSLRTSLPHQVASRQEEHQSYLPTLQDVEWSHRCSRLELTVPVQKVHWIKLPDSVSEEGYPLHPNPC
jgi:hypothetical protein